MSATRNPVATTPGGEPVELISLSRPGGLQVDLLTYGATIQRLLVPSSSASSPSPGPLDVVLGFDDPAGYFGAHPYFGSTVGRVANRIRGARFDLDGRHVSLSANRPPHCLHGGFAGFDRRVWAVAELKTAPEPSVRLVYVSMDGEEGFPGTVTASVEFRLAAAGELRVQYRAMTDAPTPLNLTNHSYFNLAGRCSTVLDHVLTLNAEAYLVCDDTVCPTGEVRAVAGTPYDFTSPAPVGREPGWFEGVRGYDNCFVLRDPPAPGEPRLAARLHSPASGVTLELSTTQPGVQLYSANFFDGSIRAKASQLLAGGEERYGKQCAVALETQHFPDAPNLPAFPSVILRPGQEYSHDVVYKFSW